MVIKFVLVLEKIEGGAVLNLLSWITSHKAEDSPAFLFGFLGINVKSSKTLKTFLHKSFCKTSV